MTGFRVETPNDYFAKSAPRDYAGNVGMALLRELAANSVDAGASNVRFVFNRVGTSYVLVAEDDGSGCSEQRVRNSILNLLGSEKEPESIGGFGRAKELLFFSNPSWVIRTRDVEVVGSYLTVSEFKTGLPFLQGFKATLSLPEGLYSAAYEASSMFLGASHVPGVEWWLNGRVVSPFVKTGKRAVKDFGFAKAFVERGVNDNWVYLRTSGLLTGRRYGYHGSSVGRVVLEVTGKSFEVLTPSRDWFAKDGDRRRVEGWLNDLVVDAYQTLADEQGDEVLFEDLWHEEPQPEEQVETVKVVKPAESVPQVSGINAEVSFRAPPQRAAEPTLSDVAGIIASDVSAGGNVQVAALRSATYMPKARADGFDMDLLPRLDNVRSLVVHTGGKKRAKVAMRWLRKNARVAERVLAAWTTAVRVVAKANKLPLDAVGFTFAETADAEYVSSKGRFGMLVNPMTFNPTADDAPEELLDRALHEATHLFVGQHNEQFVSTERVLRRKVRSPLQRGAVARALRLSEVVTPEE